MVLAWWLNYPIKYPSADRTQHSKMPYQWIFQSSNPLQGVSGCPISDQSWHFEVSWISKLRSVKFEFLGLRFADAELFESDIRQNLSENYLVE